MTTDLAIPSNNNAKSSPQQDLAIPSNNNPQSKPDIEYEVLDRKKRSSRKDEELKKDHPLHRIGFISFSSEVVVYRGRFSWVSAIFMCIFTVGAFCSLVLMLLSLSDSTWPLVSEEVSYINGKNPPWEVPPWGYVKQPNDATERKIGVKFRYAMPQFTMFYSLFSASFGLFTVAYYCSELLVQDIGIASVKNMGDIICKGVDVYMTRQAPIMYLVIGCIASVIYFISGTYFVISMLVGASTCLVCSNLGVSMNFEGGPRLTHSMNYDLVGSLQTGVRAGAIGGLSAHAMAQLGVVTVWMIVGDANALVGFGTGVSIIAFYNRIGGGIFSKGSDIGSDFVSDMIGEDVDDFQMDNMQEMRDQLNLDDKDGDGDIDEEQLHRKHGRDPGQEMREELGFITEEEAQTRAKIEAQMQETLTTMHPVNYLDAIGENIADVGGTASDLFETMCITLATSVILGAKIHEVPYFGTSLPHAIISTGTLGCALASYKVKSHERHSAARIRRNMQLNLFIIMAFVQGVVTGYSYLHWKVYRTITYGQMMNYSVITALGLCAPEVCAAICEFFTSVNCPPVSWLAKNSNLGPIQVILQGLGQGFVSAGAPSVVNIIVQIITYRLEKFYGLVLLACASQACTGWQATLAAYGSVANNACRMVHLTTVNEMAHHRANVCASVGTTMSHNGKVVAGQNAFFATTALMGALLADKRTKLGMDFQNTVTQELSEFARAGLLAGIIFAMLFLANTLTSCIKMAKALVAFCKDNPDVGPRVGKKFPATHLVPLKTLVGFAAIESFQLSFSPLCQTFAAPLVIGQLFGFKGLLMLISGGNSVCFTLNMFLINSGQAWDAARKYVLFGMLKDEKGHPVGAESEVYDTLGIGEQIGGPLEDLTGPALNNFIKFVAVVSFVTNDLYDETPEKTWPFGILQVVVNFSLISFFKFGLKYTVTAIETMFRKRKEAIEYEEGTLMLKEIEEHERKIAAKMEKKDADGELVLV